MVFVAVAVALSSALRAPAPQNLNDFLNVAGTMRSVQAAKRMPATGAAEARAWRVRGMVDEFGQIPDGAYQKATRQIMSMIDPRERFGATENVWSEVGPHNVTGRSRSLLIHPTQTHRMWMGHVSGGIWYSSDSGANWAPVDDKLPNLNITCLAFKPTDSNTMYAGTGEGYFNSDAKQGGGILRSTDGGVTWSVLPATTGFGNVNKITFAAGDANTIFATTQYGGVRKSTDGGATWSTSKSAQAGHSVEWHPTDPNKAIATVLDYDFGIGTWFCAAYYTEDKGVTWTQCGALRFNDFSARIEVAYAPSDPDTVYANSGTSGGKVYKSTDGGKNFSLATTSGTSDASWYYNDIWVDPINKDFLILTGLRCYKSTNGGQTFTNIGYGYLQTETPHPDMHAIVPDPGFNGTTNTRMFVCTDGGVHKTDDIYTASNAAGWTRLTRNANSMQFYGAQGHGPDGVLFGGSQDNGSIRINVGSSNSTNPYVFGGDGGFSAVSHANSNYLYGEYIYLQVFRSTDGGSSAGWIDSTIGDAGNGSRSNFIAPLVMDPNNASNMYGGARSLWRTTNAAAGSPTWSNAGTFGDNISAIAVAPGNSNLVYVGLNNGQVHRTTNALAPAPTWSAVDDNGAANPFPNRYVHRIVIDPSNPANIYVCLGGFNNDNLWRSTNSGSTWATVPGLPSAPLRGLAVHPTNSNELWAGTEVGIVRSTNGGSTWTAPTDGPLNVAVDEVNYLHHSTKVLAATHGRGLWLYGPVSFTEFSGPTQVSANQNVTYTLTFDMPAGAKGRTINLSSSNSAALTVPSSVTIPPRQTSVTFQATGGSVANATSVVLSASTDDNLSRSITVNVGPITMDTVQLTPSTPIAGRSGTAFKVFLTGPAPTGGAVVNLTVSNPALLSVPATLSILAGQTSRSVVVTSNAVSVRTPAWIQAVYGGRTIKHYFTFEVPMPTSLTLTPSTFTGGSGTAVTGRIDFIVPTGTGGLTVNLTSSDARVTVPSPVNVPAGATFVTFPVTHSSVPSSRDISIKVTAGYQERRGYGRIKAPAITSTTVSPSAVVGGSAQAVTMTVNLDAPAPAGGAFIYLASSNTGAARVPASVSIPAGATSATVPVTHLNISVQRIVTLTAHSSIYGKKTTTLTVNP